MAIQIGTNTGDAFADMRDRLLHRALEAEKRCDQIRESARKWKRRALAAEKWRDELDVIRMKMLDDLGSTKKALADVRRAHSETCGQLDLAYKALDDAQKQLQQAREDLRSANEDYQAQHLELLAVKANAYDLLRQAHILDSDRRVGRVPPARERHTRLWVTKRARRACGLRTGGTRI